MKYLLFVTLFLVSCASIQTLDGGEVDKTPPKVVSTDPDSAAINIKNKTIIFEFDEYIKTKNTSELLIISPSQIIPPEISVKGKKVFIQLNDSFLKNTTYSINFNGSIVDFNEGNPMDYFNYVFSTGDYIDSLSYKGMVYDILKNKGCDKCNVHLYTDFSDSLVITTKPNYLVKTDENGLFKFENLPPDSFMVFAINDENKNLLLNDKETISLSKKINTISSYNDTLAVFPYHTQALNKPKLLLNTKPGIIKFSFKNPVTTSSINLFAKNVLLDHSFNWTKDTLSAYYYPNEDTSNLTITMDTSEYSYIFIKEKNTYSLPIFANFTSKGIEVYTSYTIDYIDYSKIKFIQDSTLIKTINNQIDPQKILFTNILNKASKVKVEIDSGFIVDFNSYSNKKDTLELLPQLITYPSLNLEIELNDSSKYILQLLITSKVIKQFIINKSQKLNIPNLKPGEYKVVLIKDSNSNNLWDTGNPFTNTAPEYIKYSDVFEMRLNWDKELIINSL